MTTLDRLFEQLPVRQKIGRYHAIRCPLQHWRVIDKNLLIAENRARYEFDAHYVNGDYDDIIENGMYIK